jgi:hypothetical protein
MLTYKLGRHVVFGDCAQHALQLVHFFSGMMMLGIFVCCGMLFFAETHIGWG